MIEQIENDNRILAIIIKGNYHPEPGIKFFTPADFSQQLGYMHHPKDQVIQPHLHCNLTRQINYTQEVLIIKKGRLRVDFYDQELNYLKSRVLNEGDLILLAAGGHGFKVLEKVELIEIKQGPYGGEMDKLRFTGIDEANIKW